MAAGAGDETFEDSGTDLFEYWHRAPMGDSAGVPGYHVRRATPDDFEAIWDLVNDAFGVRRPRTLYEPPHGLLKKRRIATMRSLKMTSAVELFSTRS